MKILILFAFIAVALAELKCAYQNEVHEIGDIWVTKKNFKAKCVAEGNKWTVKIIACRTEKGTEIPIGGTLTEGDKRYTCTTRGEYVDVHWSSD